MRRAILGTLLSLAIPSLAQAAPICASGSLADYIALGPTGCMIGDALFANFGASVTLPGATPIQGEDVSVLPVLSATSLGLDFSLNSSAAANEIEDLLIRYELIGLMGLSFVSNILSMTGSSVTPDGAVTAIEEKCSDGVFGGSDPSAPCSGTLVGPLIVFDIGIIADLSESSPVFATFFDVFTSITIDGGLSGSASLGSVRNEFGFSRPQVVPEPASILLLGTGLVGVLARRRGRR